jgi:hypothetical protein
MKAQPTMKVVPLLTGVLLAAALSNAPASAHTTFAPGLFDKPASVRKAQQPKPNDSIEVRCTYYPDFMIRVIADGPTAQKAGLVRGANPPCGAKRAPGEVMLDTDDMAFEGRKGPALLFSAMDPHGSVPFVVIDAQSGKTLLKDSTSSGPGPGVQALAFDQGGLRLRYRRAFNAPCSILQNARGCWAQIVKDGLVPQDMAQQVPAPQICEAAYKKVQSPRDNSSIVIYQTEVIVFSTGTTIVSRGPVGCDALP